MNKIHVAQSLNWPLNESLNQPLDRYTTTMQGGARRSRRSLLSEAVAAFRLYLRWRKQFAKLMPDYAAAERKASEDLARKELEAEIEQALQTVYGTQADPSIKTEPDEN